MHRQLQATGRFLSLLVLRWLVAILWIEEDRDAGECGNEVLEQLKPFARQIGGNAGQPRRLATGSRDAGDEAVERVARYYNDGYCGGGLFGRAQPLIAGDKHHVHIKTGELASELRQPIEISLRPSCFDEDILALGIPQFTQP